MANGANVMVPAQTRVATLPAGLCLDAALRWFGLRNHALVWWSSYGEILGASTGQTKRYRLVMALEGVVTHRWRGFLDSRCMF